MLIYDFDCELSSRKSEDYGPPGGRGELVEVGVTPAVINSEKLKSTGGDSGPLSERIYFGVP